MASFKDLAVGVHIRRRGAADSMRRLLSVLFGVAFLMSAQDGVGTKAPLKKIEAAIRADDLTQLQTLVQSSEAANTVNGLGVTPLQFAAIYGSVESLTFLLDKGADPNSANQAGATPLIYAAWNFERSRILVQHGANVNAATKQGITPLLVAAAAHGNRKTIDYLLDKGADVKAHTRGGEDALMRASLSGDADMVKLLLGRGADAKRADDGGATALQNATTVPDSTRLRLLLAAGSDVNAYNTFAGRVKNGPIALTHMTALMTAAPYGDEDSIACLLKAGAHVNEKDSRGMTPLMFSIATDHAQLSTVRELIKAGADVQAKDQNGDSVLD
jgi:ankyrin repeat protein